MDSVRLHGALSALALALASGCAGYSPTVATDEKPTSADAYLYGRFHILNPPRNLFTDNPQTMGFAFKCADEKTYTVRFEPTEAVQVIKIAPSTCSLSEFVYTDHGATKTTRKPVPDTLKRELVFEPGKAYYLGDFQAETTQSGFPVITRTWRLRGARNNYARTTEQLKAAYPNLSWLPTENRMIERRQ
jgi:hypothetical protein